MISKEWRIIIISIICLYSMLYSANYLEMIGVVIFGFIVYKLWNYLSPIKEKNIIKKE